MIATIIAHLRILIRLGASRAAQPAAAILDSGTLQSTPGSGRRANWDGVRRRQETKVHLALDTLVELLAIHVTPGKAQNREQVAMLAKALQVATG